MELATKEQLIIATGYKHKEKQIDWLKKRCKVFEINRLGKPVITQEALFNFIPIKPVEPTEPTKPPKPRWKTKVKVDD